jgi:hypothetical protein
MNRRTGVVQGQLASAATRRNEDGDIQSSPEVDEPNNLSACSRLKVLNLFSGSTDICFNAATKKEDASQ